MPPDPVVDEAFPPVPPGPDGVPAQLLTPPPPPPPATARGVELPVVQVAPAQTALAPPPVPPLAPAWPAMMEPRPLVPPVAYPADAVLLLNDPPLTPEQPTMAEMV